MSSENISALIASLQGNGAVNGLNADISFPGSTTSPNDNDLVTKTYVDNVAAGLDVRGSCRATTTANLAATYNNGAGTLTASSNGALSTDGVTLSTNDRVLVKDQTSEPQNGIYVVTATGDGSNPFILTRSDDANTASEITGGTFTFVEEGTANSDKGFVFTNDGTPTLGTTDLKVTVFSGSGHSGGALAVADGGTGVTSLENGVLIGNGTSSVATVSVSRGSIIVGNSSNVPTALDAKTNGRILVGDGTDLNSVAVSGDVTMTDAGKVTIANDAVETAMIADDAVTLEKMKAIPQGSIIVGGSLNVPTTLPAFTSSNLLKIDNGGTGASTAVGARTSLGLAIGSDVQAYDPQLADIAGLTPTDGHFIVGDGSNFVLESGPTARTSIGVGTGDSPQFTGIELGHASDTTLTRASSGDVKIEGNIIYREGGTDVPVTDGGTGASNAADARTNLGLAIGSDVQAYDPQLADIAGLSTTDGGIIVGDGSNFVLESGPTARTSLGLGSIATQNSNNVLITGGSIAGITDLAVADGGTGLGTIAKGSILAANSANTLSVIDGSTPNNNSATSSDKVLFWDASHDTVSWNIIGNVCFLKGTKITLPDYSQKIIEDLTLEDEVLTYNIDIISEIKNKNILKNVEYSNMDGRFSKSGIRNIWINPTDSYLTINGKLNITKNHIIHFKRDGKFYFRYADHLSIGDELFTDKDKYESIESIEEIHGKTNVYNFELDKDNTYFAENYLVHHYCELCSGYANII